MSDETTEGNASGVNAQEYTVSEISGALKRAVEDQFGYVRVRAELSGVKLAASGHIYFALKDDKAVMDGVCWRGNAARLSFRPEDGLEVICSGKLTTYPARSKYQMIVDRMEPAGAGALMALLEERKAKLASEGLFDPAYKKPLPFLPKVIGVVTSPTGAVIRDILHRLHDRFPRHVIVWPVAVQGQQAADQIAAAIHGFNALPEGGAVPRPDLLIVARGGGSVEDLWSFNEESVVRAAAASDIPLISAVGHETDTTLIDYAADLRAPTPTGAAEIAVPVRDDLAYTLADFERRLIGHKSAIVRDRRDRLQGLARGLPSAKDLLGLAQQRCDDLSERLPRGLRSVTQQKTSHLNRMIGGLSVKRLDQRLAVERRQVEGLTGRLQPSYARHLAGLGSKLDNTGRMLASLSYERVLERGFALVEDADGKPVPKAAMVSVGDGVSVRFADGSHAMQVLPRNSQSGLQSGSQSGSQGSSQSGPSGSDKPSTKRKSKKEKKPAADDLQGSFL